MSYITEFTQTTTFFQVLMLLMSVKEKNWGLLFGLPCNLNLQCEVNDIDISSVALN